MDFLVFEDKARSAHGDKYDYSMAQISTSKAKIEILCPKHGSFMQAPDHHMRGRGCPSCAVDNRKGSYLPSLPGDFFEAAKAIHGNFYDYSRSVFTRASDKINITCPVHGEFSTLARKHLSEGRGCPSCGRVSNLYSSSTSFQEFFDRAVDRHGHAYSYTRTSLSTLSDVVTVTCKTHGDFPVVAASHVRGAGCGKCRPKGSSPENELADFIEGLGFEVLRNCRSIIAPLELDVVVPSLKVAFEFNGIFWHSEQAGKKHWYHQQKTSLAKRAGYRLFHVYESDWDLQTEILKSSIMNILRPENGVDCSEAFAVEDVGGKIELWDPVTDMTLCSAWVEDDTLVKYNSPFGVEPLRTLMRLTNTEFLKVGLDWPDLEQASLMAYGFRKSHQLSPEKQFFDKKTRGRLKGTPPDSESKRYYSVIDSGSIVWRVAK